MSGYVEIAPAVEGLDGWMSPDQGARLYAAASRCPSTGTIVEIGSFRGKSTIVLANGAPATAAVIAIDPHAGTDRGPQEISGFGDEASEDHRVFLANLADAGVGDRVRHLRMFSSEALDQIAGPIDVLYIDGAHRYGPARADIANWGARVGDGGTLLIHDAFSSVGVTLAILRELAVSSRFRYVGRSRSLAEYRVEPLRTAADRVRNATRQALQLPWFAKNLVLKAAIAAGWGRLARALGRREPEWPY